ncbi:hypothetical protein WICPIJ_000249 [Wickerhamomyces pijperi]|uniref:Uncharacterized protein n=1 Tax=Wickerhamomyces pijperi TaxID=599730 RepID=A0A9P8QCY4_WICPI|nr:hypothetical protein WICPIJ_000249 [Wickerhamomyces pijperi]
MLESKAISGETLFMNSINWNSCGRELASGYTSSNVCRLDNRRFKNALISNIAIFKDSRRGKFKRSKTKARSLSLRVPSMRSSLRSGYVWPLILSLDISNSSMKYGLKSSEPVKTLLMERTPWNKCNLG